MMDDILSLNRRVFLQQSAGAVAVTAISSNSAAGAVRALVVYRIDDEAGLAFAEAMHRQGARLAALGHDVVRQWRDELQHLVVEQRYQLMGRTGYADWFILRGLAAEHRLFPLHEHQPTASSFDWVIQERLA
jgi:hypothetical protein